MSESFTITVNRSQYSNQSLIHILDIQKPEAYPLTSIGVSYIAYCELKDSWLIERNGKSEPDHIDFFFAMDGEFTVESDFGKIPVCAGDLALVPSWFDRRLKVDNGSSKHLYIRIDTVDKYPHIDKIEVRKTLYANELLCYSRNIQETNNSFSDSAEYRYHLFSLVQLLLRREMWNNENETFCKLDKLFRMLNNSDMRLYNVSDLARHLGVSASSFYKICMEYYDKSPSRIIGEINMRKAADLLRCSDFSLENISSQLGYANQFAFSKAFKKNMNISPVQYRKQTQCG